MFIEPRFRATPEEVEALRTKPLQAATTRELEDLLLSSYNALFSLTGEKKPRRGNRHFLDMVSVLGQLTLPGVHLWHFEFTNPNLDFERLVWDVRIDRWHEREVDPYERGCFRNDFFKSCFPYIDKGMKCGNALGRDGLSLGYSYQYELKLSLFPNLMENVRKYHALIQTRPFEEERYRHPLYPDFHYLCRA